MEVQDAEGRAIEGYGLNEMSPVYGDALDEGVVWRGRSDLAELSGMPVRFRFALNDADLFAMRVA